MTETLATSVFCLMIINLKFGECLMIITYLHLKYDED